MSRGYPCTFFSQEPNNHHIRLVGDLGCRMVKLPKNKLSSTLEIESEVKEITDNVGVTSQAVLFIDHYKINSIWEKQASSFFNTLIAIDDLANRNHYVDFIIDHNVGRSKNQYKKFNKKNAHILVGPKYAIINNIFKEMRKSIRHNREIFSTENILVYFGSSHIENFYLSFLDDFSKHFKKEKYKLTVITSRTVSDNFREYCKNKTFSHLSNLSPGQIAKIFLESDFCIGAGGVSALERCSLGLPSCIVCIAENQIHGSDALQQAGCVRLLNNFPEMAIDFNELSEILCNKDLLRELSSNSLRLVDGNGVERILDRISSLC